MIPLAHSPAAARGLARLAGFAATIAKERGDDRWADLIDRLAARFEPKVAEAFRAACAKLASGAQIKALADAIQGGDFAQVEALLGVSVGDDSAFRGLVPPLNAAAQAAGEATLGTVAARATGTVSFDLLNPHTVAHLRRYTMGLITRVTEETREGIREAIRAGVTAGRGPLDVARDVRAVAGFGLTSQQARAVANFRAELERHDKGAIRAMLRNDARLLRDKRFDPTLRKVLQGKATLGRAQIGKMVARYMARMLKFRAEAIARTEALRAANVGAHEAIRQAVEQGQLPPDSILRRWVVAKDERTCPICRQVPKMNAQGVGLEQTFATPVGPVLLPPLHVMCRCTVVHRIKPSVIEAA